MKKIFSLIAIIFVFALFLAFVTGCDLAAFGDGTTMGSTETSASTFGTTSADITTQGTTATTTATTATTKKTTAKTTTVTTKVTTTATTTVTTKATTTVTTKATTKVTTAATTAAPKNITIFLDPGHGGSDPGVVRTYDGVTYEEADINLSVALKAKEELEKRGYTVVMSRETDKKVELTDRPELAKKAGADMFISIHVNSAAASSAYGPRMYYTSREGLSYNAYNFAKYFAEEFDDIREITMTDYPDKLAYPNMRLSKVYNDFYDLYNQRAYLAVLGAKTIPSMLIELGFITNDNDLMMLKSKWWQGYVAIAIADAVDAAYEDGVYAK